MLTIIKGRQLTQEVRTYLEGKGYKVVDYKPQTIPQNLPKAVKPKVFTTNGRFGSEQLIVKLTEYEFILIKTGNFQLVIRRFRENEKDEIHFAFVSKNVCDYAALETKAFYESARGSATDLCRYIINDIEFGKKDYIDYVANGNWTVDDLVLRLGWDFRYQYY